MVLSNFLSETFPWFFGLPDSQQNFLLVVIPLLLAAGAGLIPAVRRWIQYRIIWRGAPMKVRMNPYGARYSAGGKHFIVFPDVTITNRHSEPENVTAELLIDEYLDNYHHTAKFKPEHVPVAGWEHSGWFKRNAMIQFPLNLDGKRAVHGYVAFCVWDRPGQVPESRNKSSLQFMDLSNDKVIHQAEQAGPTMLLGSYRPI